MKYRLLTCAWMLVAASVCHAQPAAPADPLTAAREAYNAARYDDAAALFLRAVQADPKNAGLYRDLARARAWTRDSTGAVVASIGSAPAIAWRTIADPSTPIENGPTWSSDDAKATTP